MQHMASKNRDLVLNLYRTLLKKSRRATQGYEHMFRFQADASPKLWGNGGFHNISEDQEMLKRIFPSSAHKFIDNKFPFSNPKLNTNQNINKQDPSLFNKYVAKEPAIRALTVPLLMEEGNHKEVPIPIQTDPTPPNSSLSKNMLKTEYNFYRLKQLLYHSFNSNKDVDDTKALELIQDGFYVARELDSQIAINECTSVSEAHGIRVIVISKHISEITTKDNQNVFTYQIRIENHTRKWHQLLGRHWIIEDSNGKKQEVEKYQPGVVGYSPVIHGTQVFIYGSGLYLDTLNGTMKGSFQFSKEDGELIEVPVAQFKLIGNQQNRQSTIQKTNDNNQNNTNKS